jgi:hypothetical protein
VLGGVAVGSEFEPQSDLEFSFAEILIEKYILFLVKMTRSQHSSTFPDLDFLLKVRMTSKARVDPSTSFLAKCYNEASVANCEDNLATIFLLKL